MSTALKRPRRVTGGGAGGSADEGGGVERHALNARIAISTSDAAGRLQRTVSDIGIANI